MTASRRRSPITHTAALVAAMSILLAGCGIKSSLEPPRPANLTGATPDAPGVKTVQEKSSVQSGESFSLLPPQVPLEWQREKKEARDKRNPDAAKAGTKSTTPDKPFILDSLL